MKAPQTILRACSDLATATESAGAGFVIDIWLINITGVLK